VLTVSSQGNVLYGYWVGPDRFGARRYGRWVLGRDKLLVEEGKKLIDAMRLPSPVPGSPLHPSAAGAHARH
jgi:hypothetical protein